MISNRGMIKGVLAEELENSLDMEQKYIAELAKLPHGTLSVKQIKGHKYYYLSKKVGGKVCQAYLGKLPEEKIKFYEDIKQKRKQYRSQLSQVRKQINFLKGTLRGKKPI
ncbi:hypothetical protein ACFL4D_02680 [Candidatus Margulisiibacteriota bacterium]